MCGAMITLVYISRYVQTQMPLTSHLKVDFQSQTNPLLILFFSFSLNDPKCGDL